MNGKKVVITPEDWEKYKDDPTFREVRAAVEAEQAAHPGPEYDEIENPAWRTAYQRIGLSLPNYWNGKEYVQSPLPNGYSRDNRGVAKDANGNYYAPVKDISYSNHNAPFFVNNERSMMNGNTVPVRYEQVQMPEKTIRQLRQPLPVDRTLDIETLREKTIDEYRNKNTDNSYIFSFYDNRGGNDNDDTHIKDESVGLYNPITHFYFPLNYRMRGDLSDSEYTRTLSNYSNTLRSLPQTKNAIVNKEQALKILNAAGLDYNSLNEYFYKKIKPTIQEATKNAVITIGDLEKVGTFAQGGKLDTPPKRFFGVATPEVTDNNIYYSRNSLLPEINITAKGDPRKVNNDYYKAHSRARANAQQAVQEWDDRDRLVLNTMLGIGAAPVIAAHPLSFILGIAGGEGVNTGIRGVSKGRYKDFGEWSSNLITGDNSIAPLTSWLNPGYALAGASRPIVRGVPIIVDKYFFVKHPNSFTRGIGGKNGL